MVDDMTKNQLVIYLVSNGVTDFNKRQTKDELLEIAKKVESKQESKPVIIKEEIKPIIKEEIKPIIEAGSTSYVSLHDKTLKDLAARRRAALGPR